MWLIRTNAVRAAKQFRKPSHCGQTVAQLVVESLPQMRQPFKNGAVVERGLRITAIICGSLRALSRGDRSWPNAAAAALAA
jgi:hypothetical protein